MGNISHRRDGHIVNTKFRKLNLGNRALNLLPPVYVSESNFASKIGAGGWSRFTQAKESEYRQNLYSRAKLEHSQDIGSADENMPSRLREGWVGSQRRAKFSAKKE